MNIVLVDFQIFLVLKNKRFSGVQHVAWCSCVTVSLGIQTQMEYLGLKVCIHPVFLGNTRISTADERGL